MVKVAKNRVEPSTTVTANIENDPFFAPPSSKNQKKSNGNNFDSKSKNFDSENSKFKPKFDRNNQNFDRNGQKTNFDKPKFGGDKFFGKSRNFKERGVDVHSKNIRKAKDLRKPNFKGDGTKFDQKRGPKKNFGPRLESQKPHPQEKFKKLDEDSELKPKNTCKALVKYEGREEKKPFDKKKWRLQKYSKKYKLDQWEEKRKKLVLNEYYKQTKDETKTDVQKIYEQYDSDEEQPQQKKKNYVQNPDYKPPASTKVKKNTKLKVKLELERLKQEKELKKEEALEKKQEKEEALKEYKLKKMQKQKLLNKKTKRGQPVMKGRLEMLLEKIQNS